MLELNDFAIDKKTDNFVNLVVRNEDGSIINLTGFKVKVEVKPNFRSTTAIDTLTTENGRITLNIDEGVVELSFPVSAMASYIKRRYLYDVVFYPYSTLSQRVAFGGIVVEPGITTP